MQPMRPHTLAISPSDGSIRESVGRMAGGYLLPLFQLRDELLYTPCDLVAGGANLGDRASGGVG